MVVGGFREGGYTINGWSRGCVEGLEGRGGKERRVQMYYKQFGNSWGGWLVFFLVNKPSPRPLLPLKSGA